MYSSWLVTAVSKHTSQSQRVRRKLQPGEQHWGLSWSQLVRVCLSFVFRMFHCDAADTVLCFGCAGTTAALTLHSSSEAELSLSTTPLTPAAAFGAEVSPVVAEAPSCGGSVETVGFTSD